MQLNVTPPCLQHKAGSYLVSAPGEGPVIFREANAITTNLKYMCWKYNIDSTMDILGQDVIVYFVMGGVP